MDFTQFRNQDTVHIIEDAASISIDIGLENIEPFSVLISVNRLYTDELNRYLSLCGVNPKDFFSRLVGLVGMYPRSAAGNRRIKMSDATLNALYIALEIEANVGETASPNSALVTGLLMTPGPLKQLADSFGISTGAMQRIVSGSGRESGQNQTAQTPERNAAGAAPDESIIGLEDEIRQVNEFILASQKLLERGESMKFECDTIIMGATGTGKNYFAEWFTHRLHEAGLIKRREPVLIDAVNWRVFEQNLNKNLEDIADGVLILDNAQKLVSKYDANNIGTLDALFSAMSSPKKRPVIILLALPCGMNEYLAENPSVRSRFEYLFNLPGYTAAELSKICEKALMQKFGKSLDEACCSRLSNIFKHVLRNKPENWAAAHSAIKKADNIYIASSINGHQQIRPEDIAGEEDHDVTVEEVLSKLDDFVGVENVKDEIRRMAAEIEIDKDRYGGVPSIKTHFVFTGNPGTGKTTVARIFADVLKALKVLPVGHLVEADRSKLVSAYVGQTAIQTNKLIDSALGGVLFIDEAYTLVTDKDSGSGFGKEAIDTLLKRLEDDRGKFVCIVAGYTKEMHDFLQSNPGMQSRFNRVIEFKDYNGAELTEIFRRLVAKNGFTLSEDAEAAIGNFFNNMHVTRTRNFGNAREVRNIFDEAKKRQSIRLASLHSSGQYSPDMAFSLTREDIEGEKATRPASLEDVLSKLDDFVGMESVKREVRNLAQYLQFEKMRAESLGKQFVGVRDHYLFLGNPGTGKTTVARILGEIFLTLGITRNNRFVETDRSGLVAGYLGQTAIQTSRVIDSALGGILFIDEAYTLSQGFNDSFGHEAIDTILKRMEDDRGKFVCIAAGYSREMKQFIASNSGLQSRFNKTIYFEDYSEAELVEIFSKKISSEDFRLDPGAEDAMKNMVADAVARRNANFGNAREINNMFQRVKENQSNRLYLSMIAGRRPSDSELLTLTASDFKD